MAILCFILFTQYFGQNKIQYQDYNFSVLSTEHFDIYFHQGGEDIAAFAEGVLEDGYAMISEDLGIEVEFTIPVILYNSPNDFTQTNVTLGLVDEATRGFTELFKNRMVVPYMGDNEMFRHVLVHELNHVFQFAVFFPSRMEALFSGDIFYTIPLWVLEGHCEYESMGWDSETDMIMKDLVLNNAIVPLTILENYGGYIIYKEGQAFFHYVAEKYGREKVGEFIHVLKAKRNLETTFITMFGVTPEEFNAQWVRYYQLKYFPKITLQENFDEFARVVFNHKKTKSNYNSSAAISSKGDKIAFISDQSGFAELFVISSIDGKLLKKLVSASYSSSYEGLHLYQGGVSWSPDDEHITFAASSKGKDILFIVDSKSGKKQKKFELDLDGIYSPQFSPDGSEIVFKGMKDGYPDIYILNVATGNTGKVTDDIYSESFPSYSHDGALVFVSDRPDEDDTYHYGSYAIFIHQQGEVTRLTSRTSYMSSPFFSPDGGIFFVADYDSAYNLYWFSNDSSKTIKRTDILTGIFYPSISLDGEKIAFTHYNEYGYDVCVVKNPVENMGDSELPEEKISDFSYEEIALDSDRVRKYRPKFTFDYFTASASYYSFLGLSGLAQLGISDILGNHHILIASDFYGSLTTSDILLQYWYLKKRMDYGISLFQYLSYYRELYDLLVMRYLGVGIITQYPVSRILRIELGGYAYKLYQTRWHDFFPFYEYDTKSDSVFNFYYPSLALVYDNIQWGPTGPHNGRRFRLEGYATLVSDLEKRNVILDYRRYFSLSPRANLSFRLVLAGSFGADEDYWVMGGPYTMRGFDYYEFSGSRIGFLNLEYRFPFIDRLKISFPLPLEFRNVRGVLFADFGGVYSDSFRVFNTDDDFQFQDIKMDVGAGIRFGFFNLIFKLDWARAHNLRGWIDAEGNRSDWRFYLTIGPEW